MQRPALLLVQAAATALPAAGLWPSDLIAAPVLTMLTVSLVLSAFIPTLHARMLGMPSERGRKLGGAELATRGVLGLFWGTVCFHVVAVLMGAPPLSRFSHTLAWAVLMASVTAVPACCRFGSADPASPTGAGWSRCFVYARPLSSCEHMAVALPCYGALVGAWAGGCAGPLDWETAWQVWPIASAIGTCGGAAIGALLASVGTAALLPSDE